MAKFVDENSAEFINYTPTYPVVFELTMYNVSALLGA
jgi:hypothetical protein